MSAVVHDHDGVDEGWCGDATSVVEFLRPLREQLDAPGVLEVCVNRPGELLVETVRGWQTSSTPGASSLSRSGRRNSTTDVASPHQPSAVLS